MAFEPIGRSGDPAAQVVREALNRPGTASARRSGPIVAAGRLSRVRSPNVRQVLHAEESIPPRTDPRRYGGERGTRTPTER